MSLYRTLEAFAVNAERGLSSGLARLARTWPSGNKRAARVLPDWPDHFVGYMLQLTQRELGHVNAFFNVGIVKAGVNQLQQDLGAIPIRAYRGRGKSEKEIERTGKMVDVGGNIADLLHYANPEQTGRQIREAAFGSLIINGNGYWMMETLPGMDPKGPPIYLRDMPGQETREVPGKGRSIQGYEFNAGGVGQWEPVDAENVIAFRRFTPLDRPRGVSDIEAVKAEYEAEYFALMWMRELFRHGGVFPGIWTTDDSSTMVRYSDDELQDIAKRMVERHAGIDGGKVFLPIIVQGLKFIANGPRPSEIEVEKKLELVDAKIILAMGIPPWRMGIQEGGALSEGSKTDVALYFLSKIDGEINGMLDVLNERLCPRFGRDVHLKADITQHPMVQQILIEQAVSLQKLTGGKPVWSQNEVRKATRQPESTEEGADSLAPVAPAFGPGAQGGAAGAEDTKAEPKRPAPPRRTSQAVQQSLALAASDGRDGRKRQAAFQLETHRARMEAMLAERLAEQRSRARERLWAAWHSSQGQLWNDRGRQVKLAIEIEALIDPPSDGDERRAAKLLNDLLRARALDALRDLEEVAGLALEVELDAIAAEWAEFVRLQVDRAIRIPDSTTRSLLRESLADGLEAREGLDDLLARVDAVFEGRRNNVATIARTETQPAYNFAAQQAWKHSGIVEQHEWLTSRSGLGGRHSEDPEGRYRASDGGRGLDGQVRAIGEAFDVGGVALLYPGDPSAPPGETINCVCTLVPVVNQERLRWRRIGHRMTANGNGRHHGRLADYFYGARR